MAGRGWPALLLSAALLQGAAAQGCDIASVFVSRCICPRSCDRNTEAVAAMALHVT
eukprot:COSAG04_NODE_4337_length_2150_cov_1.236958_2_plen_56_part_00